MTLRSARARASLKSEPHSQPDRGVMPRTRRAPVTSGQQNRRGVRTKFFYYPPGLAPTAQPSRFTLRNSLSLTRLSPFASLPSVDSLFAMQDFASCMAIPPPIFLSLIFLPALPSVCRLLPGQNCFRLAFISVNLRLSQVFLLQILLPAIPPWNSVSCKNPCPSVSIRGLAPFPMILSRHDSVPPLSSLSPPLPPVNSCLKPQARAAGFPFALSKIVATILFGTGSKQNGSIEYAARPLDSERMAVA